MRNTFPKHPIQEEDIRRRPRGFNFAEYEADPAGSALELESNRLAFLVAAARMTGRVIVPVVVSQVSQAVLEVPHEPVEPLMETVLV